MKKLCPDCKKKLKLWDELSEVEKIVIASKHPNTAQEQLKKHRHCERCFYIEIEIHTRA
jgi:glutaredoxin